MKRQFRINIESQQLNARKAFDTADIVRNIFKPNVWPSEDNFLLFLVEVCALLSVVLVYWLPSVLTCCSSLQCFDAVDWWQEEHPVFKTNLAPAVPIGSFLGYPPGNWPNFSGIYGPVNKSQKKEMRRCCWLGIRKGIRPEKNFAPATKKLQHTFLGRPMELRSLNGADRWK